jgi:hypothetical protein
LGSSAMRVLYEARPNLKGGRRPTEQQMALQGRDQAVQAIRRHARVAELRRLAQQTTRTFNTARRFTSLSDVAIARRMVQFGLIRDRRDNSEQ